MDCRRRWQSTPVPLPGESHGQRSPAGYSPWGRKESDAAERIGILSQRLWCSVTQSCLTICDPMDYSMPGFPVHHWIALIIKNLEL